MADTRLRLQLKRTWAWYALYAGCLVCQALNVPPPIDRLLDLNLMRYRLNGGRWQRFE